MSGLLKGLFRISAHLDSITLTVFCLCDSHDIDNVTKQGV